jgi:hypothetical protein
MTLIEDPGRGKVMSWRVRTGLVTGRSHLLDARNCQDALTVLPIEHEGEQYLCGALADGCGSSVHSEVGAWLAVEFVTRALRSLLSEGYSLEAIPAELYQRVQRFLQQTVASFDFAGEDERVHFIHDCLLFTVLGFVVGPEDTVIFVAGDGVVRVNDTIQVHDQGGAPDFIGYHLLKDRMTQNGLSLPSGFIVCQLETKDLQKLALGSDGWREATGALNEVWGKKGRAGVQLLMNRWADERRFLDDAALIVVERESDVADGGKYQQSQEEVIVWT